jgi:VanZ family protein
LLKTVCHVSRAVGAHTARQAFRWGVTAVFAALVTRFCLMPGKQLPQVQFLDFPQADKLVHFCMFGLLAGLICWAADARCRHRKAALLALVAVSAYGSLIEVLQPLLLPNDRCFSLGDIAANILGAAFFAGIFLALRQWADRRHRSTIFRPSA